MADKILLISEKLIKDNSLIQLNVEGKVLAHTILDTQNIYLRPILGDSLYTKVLNDVASKAADGSFQMKYKTLLEDYIQPYLSHAVLQDVVINLHYRITNKGVLQFNDTEATSISSNDLEYFKNSLDNKTASYKVLLIDYLQKNKLVEECNTDKDITTNSIGWYLDGRYLGECL